MKVLLVEDEMALADVIARNVGARGHSVRTAASAQAAMTSLNEDWPDAMVLDINLPEETGGGVLRRLAPERRNAVRVVIISAAPVPPKRRAESNPAHCFPNPSPLDALMRALGGAPAA